MRVYFNLKNTVETIADFRGVEISDLVEVESEALRAIEELRQEDTTAADSWSGWSLQAVEGSRRVLFTLDLDSLTS